MTLDEALIYLGYDKTDDFIVSLVTAELEEATEYLKSAVGSDIFELKPNDKKIDILLKAYLDDLHDERGMTSSKSANAKRELIHSAEHQLRLELAALRGEDGQE